MRSKTITLAAGLMLAGIAAAHAECKLDNPAVFAITIVNNRNTELLFDSKPGPVFDFSSPSYGKIPVQRVTIPSHAKKVVAGCGDGISTGFATDARLYRMPGMQSLSEWSIDLPFSGIKSVLYKDNSGDTCHAQYYTLKCRKDVHKPGWYWCKKHEGLKPEPYRFSTNLGYSGVRVTCQ